MTPTTRPKILASDLDGTLIPLEGNANNRDDLVILKQLLAAQEIVLVFVTGRHFESVLAAIDEFDLPHPDWILCDVGSSIFRHQDDKNSLPEHSNRHSNQRSYVPQTEYREHLQEILGELSLEQVQQKLANIDGLKLQEPAKQGPFKLSYYVEQDQLNSCCERISEQLEQMDCQCQMIASVSPLTGDGLIDLLPPGVSKASALHWWLKFVNAQPEEIVFAGDSGNDLAAMTAGFKTIVVGNASDEVKAEAKKRHDEQNWENRLYQSSGVATSGVLDGCRHFDLIIG